MTQNIGVAYSKDLSPQNWQIFTTRIQPQSPYQPRSVLGDLTTHAWRDPFLFRAKGQVFMLLSAKSTKDYIGRNGVVGLLRIKDNNFAKAVQGQEEWEYLYPLVQPSCYSEMEVPQIYKDPQGKYELVFSTWAKNDFSPTTRKVGGLQGLTIPESWDFNNHKTESIESNQGFHVLMPEKYGLYACRIIPELGGEIVGFDIKEGGIRRSGVKTNFQLVNRDFSDLSIY